MDTDTFEIPRTGDRPLAFRGTLLSEAGGPRWAGRDWARWYELAVYRTAAGRPILSVSYHTQWEGEIGWTRVLVGSDAGDLVRQVQAVDPLAGVLGYPPGQQFAARQERLRAELRAQWDALLGEVLEALDEPEMIE